MGQGAPTGISVHTGISSWFILNLAFLVVYFHRIAPSVVADRLMSAFGVSGLSLGMLNAVYFYVYATMQIPAGMMADTWGPRKISSAGLFIMALGTGLFGLARTFGMMYVARFLVGLGASVIFVSIAKIQSEWFSPGRFAMMTGLTGFFGNAGVILGTAPLALLVGLIDWRNSFLFIGFATLSLALINWAIVRDRPGGNRTPSANLGDDVSTNHGGLGGILSDPKTWLAFFSSFGIYGTFLAFTGTWGVPYLMNVYGLTRNQAATLSMIPPVGFIFGSSFFGYASDRTGSRKWPYRMMALACLIVWTIMAQWNQGKPPVPGLCLLFFILGFFSPAFVLGVSYIKELNPPKLAGIASAIGNSGGFFGIAVMQPVLGLVLDSEWKGLAVDGVKIYPVEAYRAVFLTCAAVSAVALIFTAFLRDKRDIIKPTLPR